MAYLGPVTSFRKTEDQTTPFGAQAYLYNRAVIEVISNECEYTACELFGFRSQNENRARDAREGDFLQPGQSTIPIFFLSKSSTLRPGKRP